MAKESENAAELLEHLNIRVAVLCNDAILLCNEVNRFDWHGLPLDEFLGRLEAVEEALQTLRISLPNE